MAQLPVQLKRCSSTTADSSLPRTLQPVSAIPGPKGLPLIGILPPVLKDLNKGGRQNWIPRLTQEYGRPVVKFKKLWGKRLFLCLILRE